MEKKSAQTLVVENIMTTQVHCVTPQMTVREAIMLLTSNRISGAPVCDSGHNVMSVVSEGDLLKLAATAGMETKIATCLEKLPKVDLLITAKRSDSFTDVYKKFLGKSIHRIIVIDGNGKLQGIVSRSNMLRVLVDAGKTEEKPAEEKAGEAQAAPTSKAASE
ncbi:MAG: CBS domain-containing protein [Bdellovibrionota bacterium]